MNFPLSVSPSKEDCTRQRKKISFPYWANAQYEIYGFNIHCRVNSLIHHLHRYKVEREKQNGWGNNLHLTPVPIETITFLTNPDISYEIPQSIAFMRSILRNISNTRKSVSSDFHTLRSGLKKRRASELFGIGSSNH